MWFKEVNSEDENHLYHGKQLTCGIPQRKQSDKCHKNVHSNHDRPVKRKALILKLTFGDSSPILKERFNVARDLYSVFVM